MAQHRLRYELSELKAANVKVRELREKYKVVRLYRWNKRAVRSDGHDGAGYYVCIGGLSDLPVSLRMQCVRLREIQVS
jgi:hypothetical protein